MSVFELVLLIAAGVSGGLVVVIPGRLPARTAAGVVIGVLAVGAGLAIAAAGTSFVAPPIVLAGGILLGAGLSALALAASRPVLFGVVVIIAAGATSIVLQGEPAATAVPSPAALEAAIAERAGVRDHGEVRGIAWGARRPDDLRAFTRGLAATDVDFGLDFGDPVPDPSFDVLIRRTRVPTVRVTGREDVAILRPVPHLVLVVIDPATGIIDTERRDEIDRALDSAGESRRHLVLALGRPLDGLEMDDRVWLDEVVSEHAVDLVLSRAVGATRASKKGATTWAEVGPGAEGTETLLRFEIGPRQFAIQPVERSVGPDIAIPASTPMLAMVAANVTPRSGAVLLALPVAAVASSAFLILGLAFTRRRRRSAVQAVETVSASE